MCHSPRVFDHVTISCRCARVGALLRHGASPARGRADYKGAEFAEWDEFSLAPADEAKPVTRGCTSGSRRLVARARREFWRAGTNAGYPDDGAPGARRQYSDDYYGAFLLDPDGNSVEAVAPRRDAPARRRSTTSGSASPMSRAARRFYETIAPARRVRA